MVSILPVEKQIYREEDTLERQREDFIIPVLATNSILIPPIALT